MNIQKSIKLFSAFALMSAVWGCSPSKQVANSSAAGVYDDLYASASQTRPANLVSRESLYAAENEEEYARNPEYRGNSNTQSTDEYYSKNWMNSRSYYQNQTASNYYNNSSYYNNGYGLYNWYNNPNISFGLGYGSWSPYGYNSFASPYLGDPWGWGSSRWSYGSSFGFGWSSFGYSPFGYNAYAYNPYGFSNYYDPWAYNNYYYGRGNTYIYNNYGSVVTGANGGYSNNGGYSAPVKRTREAYSQSAYNGNFDNRNSYNNGQRGARSSSDYSNGNSNSNNTYYSRPQRASSYNNNNSSSSYNSTTPTNRSNNSSWNWSNNNSSNSSNRTSTSSWGGSSSGGSSSGGGGGGSSSGGSRGPR